MHANPPTTRFLSSPQGSSLDPKLVSEVQREAAAATGGVLVLLDSDHTEHHVEASVWGNVCCLASTERNRLCS